MNIKRVIPLVFLFFSLFYLVFAFSMEQRRMIGDQQGWDPGSRAIPLGTGFIMLGFSIYLTFSSRREKEEEKSPDRETRNLVILSILLPVLYIVVFRYIGFILLTSVMLFTLVFFYYRKGIFFRDLGRYLLGLILTILLTLTVYTAGRFVTRFMIRYGKRVSSKLLAGRMFTSLVVLIILAAILLLVSLLYKRLWRERAGRRNSRQEEIGSKVFISVVTASAITEILYLVFRQIFWVSLARGIIFW